MTYKLGPFKIVRGSVKENYRGVSYREGWWWFNYGSDSSGYVFTPEGPFDSKQKAIRNLRMSTKEVLCPNQYIIRNYAIFGYSEPKKKQTMKIVPGTIPIGPCLANLRKFK